MWPCYLFCPYEKLRNLWPRWYPHRGIEHHCYNTVLGKIDWWGGWQTDGPALAPAIPWEPNFASAFLADWLWLFIALFQMIQKEIEEFFSCTWCRYIGWDWYAPLCSPGYRLSGKKNKQNRSKKGYLFWHVPSFDCWRIKSSWHMAEYRRDVYLEKPVILEQQVCFVHNVWESLILSQL